jgi:maltose alpha-D-glucosyltransferase/alpha-amylase
MDNEQRLKVIELDKWKNILDRNVLNELENQVLPKYMMQLRWFGGKGRGVENMRIINNAVIPVKRK